MTKEAKFIERLQKDPAFYFEQVLGVESLEDFQRDKILKPVAKYSKVSIAATHSVGKTWSMARIALWFLTSFKDSKVITTAPTGRQVKKLLWGELHSAYEKARFPLGGKLLTTELQIGPEWYAMGFSPQKEAGGDGKAQTGSSFQGFHADYIMIIFDEATGIPADIHKMAEGLTTSGKVVKWVQIANPTTRGCEFFKTFSDREWFNVYMSCFDSPNLIANEIFGIKELKEEMVRINRMSDEVALDYIEGYEKPVPHLLSAQWVVSRALKWGIDHPLFQSKALGIFPDVDDNVLVQLRDVEISIQREVPLDPVGERYIGVDVARYGDDSSVITSLVGYKQTGLKKIYKRNIPSVTGEAINIIDSDTSRKTRVLVDATGIGAGVFDLLEEHYKGNHFIEVIEIHFGQSCEDPHDRDKVQQTEDRKRYKNLKAKMFDLLAIDIRDNLQLLQDDSYLEQLPTIWFSYDGQGKMVIESKDDYKTRTGQSSPDEADSLALANLARYFKPRYGIFHKRKATKPLTKSEKSSDTIKRIEKRIKVNNY